MEHIRISALRPDLNALEAKQIKAVVTLIWPYSSSQRQFALLLAEPDFRLRRKKGQVRTRFASTSARALATTGVGIGDEVVLSLQGAQFLQDGAVSTPGKSIDWELVYRQTIAVSVWRDGAEIANIELVNAVPTPAPRSPVKKPAAAPSPIPQWASPAFLKRARLSDGPFFDPGYDPLADNSYDGHDKKRRRKSYRDWKAWTYTARTPSPDKEDLDLEDDLEVALSSPSRPPQLPKTPISPSRLEPMTSAAQPPYDPDYVEESTIADSAEGDTTVDDSELHKVRVPQKRRDKRSPAGDGSYDDLYDGPKDAPPSSQYDFGGDTELNTEDEDEDEDENEDGDEDSEDSAILHSEAVDPSTTDVATELEDERDDSEEPVAIVSDPAVEVVEKEAAAAASETEEDSDIDAAETRQSGRFSTEGEGTTIDETMPEVAEPVVVVQESIAVSMPPPSLPTLQTNFAASTRTNILTPIGREPSSPNLKAVDSATLPLPSPFPGEQGVSYFDHSSLDYQQAPLDGPHMQPESEVENDADYIMEGSFFSSISSSKAGGFHQDHETAFTPVRFTFGGDGAGWSRPLDLSSPSPEESQAQTTKSKDPRAVSPSVDAELEADGDSFIQEQVQASQSLRSVVVEDVEEEVADAVEGPSNPTLDLEQVLSTTTESIAMPRSSSPSKFETNQQEGPDVAIIDPDEEQEGSNDELDSAPANDLRATTVDEDQPEIEDEVASAQQAKFTHSQVYTEANNTADAELHASNKQPEFEQDTPLGTQVSAPVSEVVDLGSSSADESSDINSDDISVVEPSQLESVVGEDAVESVNASRDMDNPQHNDPDVEMGSEQGAVAEQFTINDHGSQDIDQTTVVVSSSPEQHIQQQGTGTVADTFEEPANFTLQDDREPQLGMDEPMSFVDDGQRQDESLSNIKDLHQDRPEIQSVTTDSQLDTDHPDVKMESIEDDLTYLESHPETQDISQGLGTDPATELIIAVPDTGSKLGELHVKSVPATAPARNTRSKTKSAASPPEEEAYVSRLSASQRRTRSKESFDASQRDTTSPTQSRVRTRSSVTPTRGATQTSPYSLRSQSKHTSPDVKAIPSQEPQTRRATRRLVRRDTDFDIVPSQTEGRDLFGSMFEASQELGFGYSQSSQGRFSDVDFIKDSEEGTLHPEDSLSTLQQSNPVELIEDTQPATPRLKPPPVSSSQTQRQTRSRSRSMGQQSDLVSPSQPPHSPRQSPRLTRSTFSATPSPRVVRTTKQPAHVSFSESVISEERQAEQALSTVKDHSIIYPPLPTEDEKDIRSSPSAAPPSAQQSLPQESNSLTSADTQQTYREPPLSFQARQPEESLLAPGLTQTTTASATLHSFDIPIPGIQTQPAPLSPILRTSPRRKPAPAKPRSSSPIQTSPNNTTSPPISATKPANPPSIGLSTPLAYYTPLHDLHFFLNRSSTYHSASHPDTLTLVTTPSSPPVKAKKGPRHYSTTFSITDASIFPATRSTSVFRPYASALPVCEKGDVVLLRGFEVRSEKGTPVLRSGDESAWCVWRYGKPVWGTKRGKFGEVRAREEVKGPVVERGEGEWGEVARLREWWVGSVRGVVEGEREGEEGNGG